MPGTPEANGAVQERLDSIDAQLARLNAALMGDVAIGHHGIVGRLEKLEALAAEAPAVQRTIEAKAREGDRKLHGRLDEMVAEWSRFKYVAIGLAAGVSVAGGFGGTWLFNAFLGGG